MKKGLILLLLITLISSVHAIENIGFCRLGPLRIRSSYSLNSEIVCRLETHEKVEIIERSHEQETINDLFGE